MGAPLRIGVITAYLADDWHSQQVVAAVNRVGEAVVIRPETLGARVNNAGIAVLFADRRGMSDIDGFVLARGFGEDGNSDFLIPVYQLLARSGAVVVNRIDALLAALDKFETSCRVHQAGLPTPPVVVAQDRATAEETLEAWGRVVAKPLFGSLGLGVELLPATSAGRGRLETLLQQYGAVYLQEYVPSHGRDIRAFVVGDRVAASIVRIAAEGDFRTNVHQGATVEPCTLDPVAAEVAVRATRALDLEYAGVDLIEGPAGPVIIEVNGNPLWRGILHATGRNMAEEIVAWVVARIRNGTGKGGSTHGETSERRHDRAGSRS